MFDKKLNSVMLAKVGGLCWHFYLFCKVGFVVLVYGPPGFFASSLERSNVMNLQDTNVC